MSAPVDPYEQDEPPLTAEEEAEWEAMVAAELRYEAETYREDCRG